jgi:hypothetical protein
VGTRTLIANQAFSAKTNALALYGASQIAKQLTPDSTFEFKIIKYILNNKYAAYQPPTEKAYAFDSVFQSHRNSIPLRLSHTIKT